MDNSGGIADSGRFRRLDRSVEQSPQPPRIPRGLCGESDCALAEITRFAKKSCEALSLGAHGRHLCQLAESERDAFEPKVAEATEIQANLLVDLFGDTATLRIVLSRCAYVGEMRDRLEKLQQSLREAFSTGYIAIGEGTDACSNWLGTQRGEGGRKLAAQADDLLQLAQTLGRHVGVWRHGTTTEEPLCRTSKLLTT